MIGMHQMSYSPAAAAAAAGAQSAHQPPARKSAKADLRQRQHMGRPHQFAERDQKQDMRRLAQYHQFDSTLEHSERTRHPSNQSNIVRVPARTAHPIVVDSLPDCVGRKPRNSDHRHDSMEPQKQQHQHHIHYDAKEMRAAASSESHKTRHFLLQEALEQSSRDEQQVLLIMSDHGSKTGGIPVIGRRLPSKSFGPPPGAKPVLIQQLPPVVTEAILQHQQQQRHQQAPVIGRRSHRMLRQQLESANYKQQQRALEGASLSVLKPGESRAEGQQQQQQLMRRHASGSSNNKRLLSKRKSSARIEWRASNSCSSLCSPASPVCLESCCRAAPTQLSRCLTDYAEPQPLTVATSSAPSVCLLPCCYPTPLERPSRRHQQARSSSQSANRSSNLTDIGQLYHDPCRANARSSRKSSQWSSSRQHPRQAHQGPPVPSKPAPPVAGHLAEQLDENEHVTQMYESLAAELKAKLGNPNRAPILLPPKDYDTLSRQQGKLSGIELRRSTNPQLVGPAAPTAAAAASTLQTNPNQCQHSSPATTTGCSMSDTQSGSPTSLSPTQSAHCVSAVGEHSSSRSSGRCSQTNALTDSRVDSLHRSRSNSSSGLGSISLSARSPSSACSPGSPASKASSSEHLGRQLIIHNQPHDQQTLAEPRATPFNQEHELDKRRGKGIENHNPSKVSDGILWNGRVEIPLKVNSERRNGNTYLATRQIIY